MCPVEKAIARAMERYLATVSIPRALAAVDGFSDFDPTYGGDPDRFAAVSRWRKALADGGAEASDPALMLDAMCSLFAVAAMRVPVGPALAGERVMKEEQRDAVASCVVLAQELAEMFDEANGTEIGSAFLRQADAMIAGQSAGVRGGRQKMGAKAGSRLH